MFGSQISVPASKVLQGAGSTTGCITVTQSSYIAGEEDDYWPRVAEPSGVMREGLAVLPSLSLPRTDSWAFWDSVFRSYITAFLLYLKQDPAAQSEKRGPSKSRAEISTLSKRQRCSGVWLKLCCQQAYRISCLSFFFLTRFQVWGAPLRPKIAANLDPSHPFIVDTYLTLPDHVLRTYLATNTLAAGPL